MSNTEHNASALSLDEMRKSRELAVVAYKKFTEDYSLHKSCLFCFYEGEDGKYYDLRIRKYFSDIITYKAGNKSQVIKAFNIIKSKPEYAEVNKMFFIDRDYDDSIAGMYEDLYETPCYSIENLYVKEICFKQILQSEFSINPTDVEFIKCMNDFKKRYDEFHEVIIAFNAMVLLKKQKKISNSKFNFKDMSTNGCIDICIREIKEKPKFSQVLS